MIRRASILAPIALLTSGCIERTYTPADFVDGATVPPPKETFIPARNDVTAQWQLPPESPWAPYQKLTLLASLDEMTHVWSLPDVEQIDQVHAARGAAYALATAGLPRDAAWIVDLRGAASVAFARALAEFSAERLAVVPTFNHWPSDEELIPAEETLAAMVRMPPAKAIDPNARPMFLLDSWRLAFKDAEIDEETTDNRYALTSADLPSGAALRARGVSTVVYVVPLRDDEAREEDDLNAIFRDYQEQGIAIVLVGLDDLSMLRAEEPWETRYARWRLVVVERPIVVTSPSFYFRSHGGWGGVHAVPHGGVGWHYGIGGG